MASCAVDKARKKPVLRLNKAKENPARGQRNSIRTVCEADKAKPKQGERQMKPIRDKVQGR
jgi:hypothetical protein